jgi:hypothetical protein
MSVPGPLVGLLCDVIIHQLRGPGLVLVVQVDPPAILARATIRRILGLGLAADVVVVVDRRMVQLAGAAEHRKRLAAFALEPKRANIVSANSVVAVGAPQVHGPLHVGVRVERGHG